MHSRHSSLSSQHTVGVLLMCLAGFAWAVSIETSRLIPTNMPVQQIIWARYSMHLIVVLALVMLRRRGSLLRTSKPRWHVFRGLMMLAMPVAFVLGAARLSSAEVWALVWFAPVLAVAIGWGALGETPRPRQWTAVTLGFVGTAIALGLSPATLRVTLAAFPLAAAAALALFAVITRNLRDEETLTGILYTALCVVIPMSFAPGVFQPLTTSGVVAVGSMSIAWLVFLVTLDEALKRAPLGTVAPFLYSQLLWVEVIDWVGFGDPIGHRSLLGALLVLAGCALGFTRPGSEAAPDSQPSKH